jgi:hypothetical protein
MWGIKSPVIYADAVKTEIYIMQILQPDQQSSLRNVASFTD